MEQLQAMSWQSAHDSMYVLMMYDEISLMEKEIASS